VNEADRAALAAHQRTHREVTAAALRLQADAVTDDQAKWVQIQERSEAALARLRSLGWPGSTLLRVRTWRFGLPTTTQRAGWPVARRTIWDRDGTVTTPCWLISTGAFAYGPGDDRLDGQPFPRLTAMHGFEDLVIEGLEALAT
jgi:hypothetical protein